MARRNGSAGATQPVIVGVGQVANKDPDRLVHPVELMAEAARRAAGDAGADVLPLVAAVHAAPMTVYTDDDASAMVAERLGLAARQRMQWSYSGAAPQTHLGEICRQIAAGEIDAGLAVGGVADASVRNARRLGVEPPAPPTVSWSDAGVGGGGLRQPTGQHAGKPSFIAEGAAGAALPTAMFALIDSAIAGAEGRTPDEHRRHLGRLLHPFTEVAALHPDLAWNAQVRSAEEISSISPANRAVAEPYTKLMCSFPTVDLAAAVLVVSSDVADRLGIPQSQRVYPWTVAAASEAGPPSLRLRIDRSQALDSIAAHALEFAASAQARIGAYDLYSCFPAAVELAMSAFGLGPDDLAPLTLTGGLPYFGGPGASYVLHSIVCAVERCREEPSDLAAVVGVGGAVQNFSVGLYGSDPGPGFASWTAPDLEAEIEVAHSADGPALVEAATVLHDRDDGPVSAPVLARLPDGRRVGARAADRELPKSLSGGSLVGATVELFTDGKRVWYTPA